MWDLFYSFLNSYISGKKTFNKCKNVSHIQKTNRHLINVTLLKLFTKYFTFAK